MELLVVLTVIGVIATLSAPALTQYATRARLDGTTRQIVGLLTLARMRSIGSRQSHAVRVDPAAGRVTVRNVSTEETLEQQVRLPRGVAVAVWLGEEPAPEPVVTFRTSGALTGRTMALELDDGEHRRRITITGPTGAVTVADAPG